MCSRLTTGETTTLEILSRLDLRPRPPFPLDRPERRFWEAVDAEILQQAVCAACGHQGLHYQAAYSSRGRYQPLSICPQCGQTDFF